MSNNKKKSVLVTASVAALATISLAMGLGSDQEDVQTSERDSNNSSPSQDSENTASKENKTSDSDSSDQNDQEEPSAEAVQQEINRQNLQADRLRAMDVPFAERIEQGTYVAQEGDTVEGISQATAIPSEDIVRNNQINDGAIQPGQRLILQPTIIPEIANSTIGSPARPNIQPVPVANETPDPTENENNDDSDVSNPTQDDSSETTDDTLENTTNDDSTNDSSNEDDDSDQNEDTNQNDSDDSEPSQPEEPEDDVDNPDPVPSDNENGAPEPTEPKQPEEPEDDVDNSNPVPSDNDNGTPEPTKPEEPEDTEDDISDEDVISSIPEDELNDDSPQPDESEVVDSEEETVPGESDQPENPDTPAPEEQPELEGETNEETEIIDEETVPENPGTDVPEEGTETPESEGETDSEVIGVDTETIPGEQPPAEENDPQEGEDTPDNEDGEVPEGEQPNPQPEPEPEPAPEIVRETQTIQRTTPLLPGVVHKQDPNLPVGESRVEEGVAGERVQVIERVTENGTVVSESVVDESVTPSQPKVIYHGTMAPEVTQTTRHHTVSTVLHHGVEVRENPDLPKGQQNVLQKGVDGKRVVVYEQVLENGEIISETAIDSSETPSQPRIIEVGTKEESVPDVNRRVDTVRDESVIPAPEEPIVEYSDSMAKGEYEVTRQAQDGLLETLTDVTYENDQEISREVVSEQVIQEPVQAVVVIGTAEEQAPVEETHMITEEVAMPAPSEPVVQNNPDLPQGESRVVQEAQDGLKQVVSEITTVDGEEVSREVVSEQVISEAQPQIIERGTAVETTTENITEEVAVPAPEDPVIEYSEELDLGEKEVKQEAQDGVKEVTTQITYKNGKEVGRAVIDEQITQEAQPQIIVHGTREAEVEETSNTEDVVIPQPETIRRETNDLYVGEEEVIQEGRDGLKEVTTTTITVDSEVQSEDVTEHVVREAQPTIIAVGTEDKIEVEEDTEDVTIPQPDTIYRETMNLEKGQEETVQEGIDGLKEVLTTITYKNGEEVARDTQETVVQEAQPTIVHVGIAPVITTETIQNTVTEDVVVNVTENLDLYQEFQIVHDEGRPQIIEQTIEVTYKDGEPVSEDVVNEVIAQEGTVRQVEQGTREDVKVRDFDVVDPVSPEETYERAQDYDNLQEVYDVQYENRVGMEFNGTNLPATMSQEDIDAFNHGNVINDVALNVIFTDLVNQERKKHNMDPLTIDSSLKQGADQRALEMAQEGDISPVDHDAHGKPNVTDEDGNELKHHRPLNPETGEYEEFYTAFDYRNKNPKYAIGENIAATSYSGNPYGLASEKYMANRFFNAWTSSAGHYQNMVSDLYTGSWISIKVGEDDYFNKDLLSQGWSDNITAVHILAGDSHLDEDNRF